MTITIGNRCTPVGDALRGWHGDVDFVHVTVELGHFLAGQWRAYFSLLEMDEGAGAVGRADAECDQTVGFVQMPGHVENARGEQIVENAHGLSRTGEPQGECSILAADGEQASTSAVDQENSRQEPCTGHFATVTDEFGVDRRRAAYHASGDRECVVFRVSGGEHRSVGRPVESKERGGLGTVVERLLDGLLALPGGRGPDFHRAVGRLRREKKSGWVPSDAFDETGVSTKGDGQTSRWPGIDANVIVNRARG